MEEDSVCRLEIKDNFDYVASLHPDTTMQDTSIVIKPGLGVDPVKEPGLGFHRSTRVNSGQSELTRKN